MPSAETAIEVIVGVGICGNTVIEGSEDCEGDDLGGQTCASLGYESGPLACDIACSFDTSLCLPLPSPAVVTTSFRSESRSEGLGGAAFAPGLAFSGVRSESVRLTWWSIPPAVSDVGTRPGTNLETPPNLEFYPPVTVTSITQAGSAPVATKSDAYICIVGILVGLIVLGWFVSRKRSRGHS